MTDRYAVIGNPIEHSKSPAIHARFARQTGEDVDYGRLLGGMESFEDEVRAFRGAGGRGLNVTVPFKLRAFALATRRSARAEMAQAVNTLRFDGGEIYGDNTDGAGLVRDIEANAGVALAGRRVLLLGAGGAAAGVLRPLLDAGPAEVAVHNRTASRAAELARRCGDARARALPSLSGLAPFDVVVNATAGSLNGEAVALPAALLAPGCLVYDMMYGAAPSAFLRGAAEAGAAVRDGLGMLVEQAAESFFLWRGVRPDTGPVLAALRAELSAAAR